MFGAGLGIFIARETLHLTDFLVLRNLHDILFYLIT